MKKLYLLLFMSLFLISLVSAVNECGNDNSYLGTFKQGQMITLRQTCTDCSYVNLSAIIQPNSTVINNNTAMIKNGIEFSLDSLESMKLGCYSYKVIGDKGGVLSSETFDYRITPSGESGTSNLFLFIIGFILFYGLIITGIRIKNPWISLVGCFCLAVFAGYTSIYGIDLYKNDLTMAISYSNIAICLGIGFQACREILDL